MRAMRGHPNAKYVVYDINQNEQGQILTEQQVWDHLGEIFPDSTANPMNMLIGSTSGVHGSYRTLDAIEARLKRKRKHPIEYHDEFTVLVIQPRVCVLQCGNVVVRNLGQVKWLRELISSSVSAFVKSQEENVTK